MTPPPSPARFATTRWSVVLQARADDTGRAHAALSELCQQYWLPLYTYVRGRGYSRHDAEDLTQGFFARVLRLHSLERAHPERGRFRAYLLAALKNYLCDERDRAHAQKRNTANTLSLDLELAEHRYHASLSDPITPEQRYDRQWALTLLEQLLHRLQAEYEATGRGPVFEALRFTITGEPSAVPYADLAPTLGTTPQAVRVAVHRLRKRYRALLHEAVAETVSDPSEIPAELAALRRSL